MHPYVHCITIYNSHATEVSIKERMHKEMWYIE